MQLGMIGLGRMGANMIRRVMKAGHEGVVWNRSPEPVQAARQRGRRRGRHDSRTSSRSSSARATSG